MYIKTFITFIIAGTAAILASCGTIKRDNHSTNPPGQSNSVATLAQAAPPYLGQPVPGLTVERFAPDIVCTKAIELNSVFSRDGREFYFTRLLGGVDTDTMHQMVFADGKWSQARELLLFPNQARVEAADMVLSADGQELYFLARYALAGTGKKPNYDIWLSRRVNGEWSLAELVGPPISTEANELYPVLGSDGSLYFNSDRSGKDAIYRAQRRPGGGFDAPVKLGPTINSEDPGDMCLAPDESYLVMSARRLGSREWGDLHVSFRQVDGSWGELVSLGDKFNTKHHEWCPMVTPDGKYLFFSRWFGDTWATATDGEVYWVDARILDQFRPKGAAAK